MVFILVDKLRGTNWRSYALILYSPKKFPYLDKFTVQFWKNNTWKLLYEKNLVIEE